MVPWLLPVLLSPLLSIAEEVPTTTIVISANRVETELRDVASAVTVIDEDDIKRSQQVSVAELLRSVPGVAVVQSGPSGGNTAVFIRGANPEHTLVIVDGIEMNNPGSTARFFNFANLSLDSIERIEVLRGPQSGIYGSDAIGGVIRIVTKRGEPGLTGQVSTEAGSYGTFIQQLTVSGASDAVNATLGISRQDVEGISSAAEQDGNFERDGYENTSYSLRLGAELSEALEVIGFFRGSDADSDIDNRGGVGGDDPNRVVNNREQFSRLEARTKLFGDKLSQVYAYSYTKHRLRDDNDPDFISADFLRSTFRGELSKWELQNSLKLASSTKLIFGLETEQEQASSSLFSDGAFGPFESRFDEVESRTNGYYSEILSSFTEDFSSAFALRLDNHSQFGNEVTFRVAPTYHLAASGTQIKATYGSAFRSPSLFQLFSSFGNPELQAEESRGWDLGFEQELGQGALFGARYFQNDIDELINFDNQTFIFENIDQAEIQGTEVFVSADVSERISLRADYTYTRTKDKATSLQLLRRPKNTAAVQADYRFADGQASFSPRVRFVGSRADNDFSTFPAERVRLASYTLVDLLASYDVSESISIFGRVENLFDKSYEEVLGFGTTGIAAYGGVQFAF
jgi:vitamin B12 transporter